MDDLNLQTCKVSSVKIKILIWNYLDPEIWNGDIWTALDRVEDNEPPKSESSLPGGLALPRLSEEFNPVWPRDF